MHRLASLAFALLLAVAPLAAVSAQDLEADPLQSELQDPTPEAELSDPAPETVPEADDASIPVEEELEEVVPGAHGGEAAHEGSEHAEEGGHGDPPPIWLVIPFVVLLLMIATGPLFYPHFWHHHYPKVAIALGAIVAAYYLIGMGEVTPIEHAAMEYFSFIALLGSLFVASGCILIKTDFAGTPRANAILLFVGGVISNFIGTTGASMLLIRPYMRLNAGRLKPYHIIFFIFIVSNIGGALTPIGDPPLFLGFLRGVPFFWTVVNLWQIWLPTILLILAVFYVIDSRNKEESIREEAEDVGIDVEPGEIPGRAVAPEAPGIESAPVHTRKRLTIEGKAGFAWLAIIIGSVFLDPNIMEWMQGTVLDLHGQFHVPFGIREVIMFAVCYFAYKTAKPHVLAGNDFNFEPIKEVGYLFIGIFLTMQPALTLIGSFAANNAGSLGVTQFYFGTGILSGVLDNAPTYVSFLSAAMGKFGSSIENRDMVEAFALGTNVPAETFYLEAISIAAVFFGALTYIGNGPNFMVKAIAESSGVETPSFVTYIVKYSLPILIPIYILVWFVFFSGMVIPHPPDAAGAEALSMMIP
ncbi:sodium:proton antiporter [Rubricoccus marinus]|uniref:Citrate transporter n=1 Tax=Rubricoccus marinus TaxID=716817 RepID=A0A259TYV4_9BACT|nr:sodium:proton antiporter [Rubricoccus marinus]OZC02891.1 hypothetical protein BSZ36_07845 [Rubricoccus marinus]